MHGTLKPFFCFFGGKWRAAPRYPKPEHGHIIEPFAGAAGYATRYAQIDVTLVDADPVICGVWNYLIRVKPSELLALPLLGPGYTVDELDIPQEAKHLIGFWCNKGSTGPRHSPSAWMRSGVRPKSYWGKEIRERLARQVNYIRHWKVINGNYTHAPHAKATWFIDPPYSGEPGKLYRYKLDDYQRLRDWVKTRRGQVIVCERKGADWLPFKPFAKTKATPGSRGKGYSQEVVFIR